MDVEMDTSPSFFDPEDLSTREKFRRYGKRHLGSNISPHQENSASKFSESRLLYDGQSIHSPTNAALLLENIKQEVESIDPYHLEGTPGKTPVSKRRSPIDGTEVDVGAGSGLVHHSIKLLKQEEDSLADDGDTTFALFASLLDSALQGLMSFPDLILRFERSCRNVSESIRYGSNIRHRIVEDKFMRQKAQLLLDEAASWSLLCVTVNLLLAGTEEIPKELTLLPSTSHLEACQFVAEDHTAQLCLRIVQWLEGLASKALDLERKVRGSHVGACLPSSGIWYHTQCYLKKGASSTNTIHHLDFDAPTREHAQQLPDDKKQDESLLEDVWTLLRAGRLEEACHLCRSAGQPWRAATLCVFGGLDQFPSIEALVKNGKDRTLQAIELESGIGHQWHLWKWASYCASEKIAEQDAGKYESAVYAAQCSNLKRMLPICTDWESACWAMAKSWLDVQVDLELAHLEPGRLDQFKSIGDAIDGSPGHSDGAVQPSNGPGIWPLQVLNQQPRQLSDLLQKLHSGELVHESVTRGCKEQQRQIEMILMLGDIARLLDLIWSWIAPSEDDQNVFRPHGDPQMIRFGAHLVLVLRYLLGDEMDAFREKIMNVGDLIVHMYAMFLFSKQHEELVGIYASQLARHRCIDLFVHMMELRLNSSVHVKYKIFLSAMEYLQFSPVDNSKGSFEEIVERVLSRSREIKVGKYDKLSDVAEQHRLQSLPKAMVIQWLCFTPPSTITNVEDVSTKLLLRALMHSNILFREFALVSMWRVPAMPIGAHTLLSFLAEPLKQLSESSDSLEDYNVSQNLEEFHDWSEYYSCDAKYRNWLKLELENAEVSPLELSTEEKQRAILAAKETLNSSLSLLLRKENPWLAPGEDHVYESVEPIFLELHATAMLCLRSGGMLASRCNCVHYFNECSLLFSKRARCVKSATNDKCLKSSKDNYCVEVVLRCLAVAGDGLGQQEYNDGGILSTVMAAGFKGELLRFQSGVTMEISRLDAWYSSEGGSLESPATYIVQGLCRRCCIPEVILRCMEVTFFPVSLSLIELGMPPEGHDQLIDLVASSEAGVLHLFSHQQLQEFLLVEREYSIRQMELEEELSS
ncbi:nuclear pore complex protein NUP107 isoform X2 [Prunus yedoensis var. nudiflora]|uniref:Nuclear pore complex protein n=1 Tax=Prunus yedoensis var. nudiflora TaxID=2094558 RepID=A0A314USJ3_PRUYE|nr:nuclear pore complex protein NUP107 isoform X2 [Prunus yedoensis var. nudiflora]